MKHVIWMVVGPSEGANATALMLKRDDGLGRLGFMVGEVSIVTWAQDGSKADWIILDE